VFASRCVILLALTASLSGAGCAVFEKCESACAEDARLRDEVSKQINARSSLRIFNIDIQTHRHAVYLGGLVDTEVDRGMAGDIAMAVPGVTRVYNGLALMGNGAQ
jgi:osmotically-inducible protein OsmY